MKVDPDNKRTESEYPGIKKYVQSLLDNWSSLRNSDNWLEYFTQRPENPYHRDEIHYRLTQSGHKEWLRLRQRLSACDQAVCTRVMEWIPEKLREDERERQQGILRHYACFLPEDLRESRYSSLRLLGDRDLRDRLKVFFSVQPNPDSADLLKRAFKVYGIPWKLPRDFGVYHRKLTVLAVPEGAKDFADQVREQIGRWGYTGDIMIVEESISLGEYENRARKVAGVIEEYRWDTLIMMEPRCQQGSQRVDKNRLHDTRKNKLTHLLELR